MSDTSRILKDSADRLFTQAVDDAARQAAAGGGLPTRLWNSLEEMGLPRLFSAGGPGDAHAVLRAAGYHAAPVPLAETMMAHKLLTEAGMEDPGGILTIAPVWQADVVEAKEINGGWSLSGRVGRIPWLAQANAVLIAARTDGGLLLACLPTDSLAHESERARHDEPRGRLRLQNITISANAVALLEDSDALLRIGALLRASQMAGALESTLDITVQYAGEREQFGRPLAKFQAIQQQLAILADEVSAGAVAAREAIEYVDSDRALLPVAAAKARLGEAAGRAAAIAHQAHGAIGFTAEYALNHRTKRLWGWRDDFGTEKYWQERLGEAVIGAGADNLWPKLTETD